MNALPACKGDVVAIIQQEIYRTGARPLLLVGQDSEGAGINFPGGKLPNIELGKITPWSTSSHRRRRVHPKLCEPGRLTFNGLPASPSGEPLRTPAQIRLAQLLNQ
jgi:hypothetical protein